MGSLTVSFSLVGGDIQRNELAGMQPALKGGNDLKSLKFVENFATVYLKHKRANINVKSRRFGIIVTPFSRQSEQIMRYR